MKEKGCHFGWFLSNTCHTQMVNSVIIKPKLVCEFFADGWLLLWCDEVLAIIHFVFVDENQCFEPKILPKWCSDGIHASPIKLPIFLMKVAHIGRLRCNIVIKDNHFRELQLLMSLFSHISINFHPKKTIEYTTTSAVFKWELVQHITVIILKRYWFFHIGNPIIWI